LKRFLGGLLGLAVLAAASAWGGHELSFYPSYYPQEIRVESHAPAAAAALLEKNALHAYVGADPFAGASGPAHVKSVESLAGYLVIRFDTGAPAWREPAARCAAARALAPAAVRDHAGYVLHPYPVTPYHGDYLQHADLAEAAQSAPAPGPVIPTAGVRVETIAIDDLLAGQATAVGGWLGPPWLKEGWFHAYRLLAGTLSDPAAGPAVEDLFRRLTTGAADGTVERLNLERALVSRLTAGCERVVAGYVTRRERYTADFSDGIENVAADSQAGLGSEIFLRTAKLKDFPWNGWLRLGVPGRPTAAWNPIAGFTDPAGRLLWRALGDPAFFPAPGSASWIGNRVTLVSVSPVSEVPRDALLPEPGTGIPREIGRPGAPAAVRVLYRVLGSKFHDGTTMTVADTLHALGFAYRWGSPGGPLHDPAVEAGTARLRGWLAGFKVLRVDTLEREFGEVKFSSPVQTIEVYGRYRLGDDQQTASLGPPWSPIPWTVLELAEMAVRGKFAAFSADEARRLGVPWLDLARDPKVTSFLARMLTSFVAGGPVPLDLAGRVTPAEQRERWSALHEFFKQHKHLLVTSGPYQLKSWSSDAVVLDVFRDFSYPIGVGSYDRYPIPLRAYVTKTEVHGDRLEVQADVDVIQKFQREYAVAREPLRSQPAPVDVRDVPVCRFVVVAADGAVVATGTAPPAGQGVYAVSLAALPRPGRYTALLAFSVRDNVVGAEVRAVTVDGS
jgi:hypothetical protein